MMNSLKTMLWLPYVTETKSWWFTAPYMNHYTTEEALYVYSYVCTSVTNLCGKWIGGGPAHHVFAIQFAVAKCSPKYSYLFPMFYVLIFTTDNGHCCQSK